MRRVVLTAVLIAGCADGHQGIAEERTETPTQNLGLEQATQLDAGMVVPPFVARAVRFREEPGSRSARIYVADFSADFADPVTWRRIRRGQGIAGHNRLLIFQLTHSAPEAQRDWGRVSVQGVLLDPCPSSPKLLAIDEGRYATKGLDRKLRAQLYLANESIPLSGTLELEGEAHGTFSLILPGGEALRGSFRGVRERPSPRSPEAQRRARAHPCP